MTKLEKKEWGMRIVTLLIGSPVGLCLLVLVGWAKFSDVIMGVSMIFFMGYIAFGLSDYFSKKKNGSIRLYFFTRKKITNEASELPAPPQEITINLTDLS